MSFGFSIGDFLTVIELINKIRREFINAPSQFKNISDEIRSLSIVIQDADVVLSECEPNVKQKTDLQEVAGSCYKILSDLEKTLDKYDELQTHGGNLNKKVKRVWKKLKWEPEDIRELRDRITSNVILLNTYIAQISGQIVFAAKKGVDRLNERQDDQERFGILNWLTPIDYAPQQSDFINRRQAGTGQWLLGSPKFHAWLQADKQTLFCPGIPGAGKTIITSIVVEELTNRFRNDKSVGIAYIYCNFRRKDEQKVDDLLASLLKQLAESQPSLPGTVKELYDRHKKKRTRPSLDEISRSLQAVTTLYSRVFIIVDALDECQTSDGCRQRILLGLFNLQAKYGINLFATSRPISSIEKEFEGNPILEIRANEEDVRRYLESHMFRLPGFVVRSLELQEEIKTNIAKAVDGMFLLAQLYLESLTGKRSPKTVRTTLKNLAIGTGAYDHAYEDAMERINGQIKDQEELANQVLLWIICAKRQLTTTELQHALGVEVGEFKLDKDNISHIEDIVSVCAGLVTIDEESGIIRLVHYTAQEYFERTQSQWFPDAQTNINIVCVTYLSFDEFEGGICENHEEFEQRLELNKLYDHAAHNWGYHACVASAEVEQLILDFLKSKAKVSSCSQAMMASRSYYGYSQRVPRQMIGVHLAAYFGLREAIIALLKNGHDLDSKDTHGRTPLWYAAVNRHEAIVQLLLDKGAELESKDKDSQTLLWWTAINGDEAMVQLLLDKSADIDAEDNLGWTALQLAAFNKCVQAEQLLVLNGASEPEDFYGLQVLFYIHNDTSN